MKILLDEMRPALIAERLRERGHDVEAVDEHPELRGFTDPELFAHTQRAQRAIATYNHDDFLALDRLYRSEGRNHHGDFVARGHSLPDPGVADQRPSRGGPEAGPRGGQAGSWAWS